MSLSRAIPESELQERLRFETVLAELSSRFVKLPADAIDQEILDAQRRVCESLDLDLSSLWQWDAEAPMRLSITHLYRAGDGPPIPDQMDAEAFFPWCQEQVVAGKTLVGPSMDALPPDAVKDREMTEAFGIKSFLLVPLMIGGEAPIGAITFNTTRDSRSWPDEVVRRLELVSQVFANALERARSEETLRESEERFALAADSAEVGMWMLDIEAGRFWANDRGRLLFGYSPDTDVTVEVFLDSVHPDDRERVSEVVRRAIESGAEVDVDYRVDLPDGGTRWIQSRGRIQSASSTMPARLQGASVDITDRKSAEELQRDQLRFETMLSELSARFVEASCGAVDTEIVRALRKVGECFECDRSGLLRVEEDPPRLHVAYAWYREGIDEVPEDLNLAEVFPWTYRRLVVDGEPVSCSSLDDLPGEAEQDRRTLEKFGTKSFQFIPLAAGDGVRWLLTASNLREHRPWPSGFAPRLRLLGEVFLNALERARVDEALRQSYDEVETLRRQLELENAYLKREHRLQHGSGRIVGESRAIMKVLEMAEQVAPTTTTVLVEGATGTGKELIAQRIHELSPRHERPMVKVNCAALPSTLVESELFGREKGAYTGAVSREPGRFEVANGSTLFLDEISELPLELQAKLLRVLEEGQYERVGSSRTRQSDVRVIAATNRDLQAEIEAGRFRRDLFFRLAVFPIHIPPLTERRGDIPLLVWSAVEEFSAAMHKSVESISRIDMDRLQSHHWPGNVRELRNVVERAMILCNDPVLAIELPVGSAENGDSVMSLDEAQRRQIAKAVEVAGGRISGVGGAAELLGLKPTTLRSKMDRLGMNPRRPQHHRSLS